METITLKVAEAAGFEPRAYSGQVPWGKLKIEADFIGQTGPTGESLFVSLTTNGERFCLPIHLSANNTERSTSVLSYLQRGDICEILTMHADGMSCIRSIDLITQKPLCKWREQCDQLSPCCVFKS